MCVILFPRDLLITYSVLSVALHFAELFQELKVDHTFPEP